VFEALPAIVVAVTAVIALLFASPAAIGATLGLIGETLFLVERLLTLVENELGSTIFARDVLVWHVQCLLDKFGHDVEGRSMI
jgi:hypothetical protein